jgi:hypothetical protein
MDNAPDYMAVSSSIFAKSGCGRIVKLKYTKRNGGTRVIYQKFRHKQSSFNFPDDSVELNTELHKKLGGRDYVNLNYDGDLHLKICPKNASKC